LFALDFDFDAEGGADVAALDDGAANPDVVWRKADGVERVEESAAAGIADEWMTGVAEIVVVAQLFQVADIFELAIAKGGFAGEGPIPGGKGGGARGQAYDGGWNTFTGEVIANKKVRGGPGLGEFINIGDHGIGVACVGQCGVGIRWRRRNFDLGSLLDDRLLDGLGSREPADGDNQNEADGREGDNERKQRVRRRATRAVAANAGNLRHFGFQVGGSLIFSHSASGSFGTRVVLVGAGIGRNRSQPREIVLMRVAREQPREWGNGR
jgi:hypothetical protein